MRTTSRAYSLDENLTVVDFDVALDHSLFTDKMFIMRCDYHRDHGWITTDHFIYDEKKGCFVTISPFSDMGQHVLYFTEEELKLLNEKIEVCFS